MMHKNKPDACNGCPLYDNNDEFIADAIPPSTRVLVVWDLPSAATVRDGCGKSGQEKMVRVNAMKYTQIPAYEVGFAHLMRCRQWIPPKGKSPAKPSQKPPKGKMLKQAIQHCRIHDVLQPEIEALVALGPLAWKVISDNIGSRSKWRGYYHERDDEHVAANWAQTLGYIQQNVSDEIIEQYFPGLEEKDEAESDDDEAAGV